MIIICLILIKSYKYIVQLKTNLNKMLGMGGLALTFAS